jgi:hypothetical protein
MSEEVNMKRSNFSWLTTLKCLVFGLTYLSFFQTCRVRDVTSEVKSTEPLSSESMSTQELHQYLGGQLAKVKSSNRLDDGMDPTQDIWEFYIDPVKVERTLSFKILPLHQNLWVNFGSGSPPRL